jgi:hypothetical protein
VLGLARAALEEDLLVERGGIGGQLAALGGDQRRQGGGRDVDLDDLGLVDHLRLVDDLRFFDNLGLGNDGGRAGPQNGCTGR